MPQLKILLPFFIFFCLLSISVLGSQTTQIKKWSLSERTTYFEFLDLLDIDFTDLGMKVINETNYYIFRADIEIKDVYSPAAEIINLTLKEKVKECYKANWTDECLQEIIDFYIPLEISVEELKADFKDFYNGIKKTALTDKVAFQMIDFNKKDLKLSFYVGIKDKWLENQKFKLGRTSLTFESGTITIEYVENLDAPVFDLWGNDTLVTGGGLDENDWHSVEVCALWTDSDRRTTNYTRSCNCTSFYANSTHRAVNISWAKVDNANQYWIKFDDVSTCQFYTRWYGNATGTGSVSTYMFWGDNATHQWFFKNITAGASYSYDSPMSSTQDINKPMMRCWGTGTADFEDFYNASDTEGWGVVTETDNAYDFDSSISIGSQWGECDLVSLSQEINYYQYFFVYNGSARFGYQYNPTTYQDRVNQGSLLYMRQRWTSSYGIYGDIWVEQDTTLKLFGSSWYSNDSANIGYNGRFRLMNNGTVEMNGVNLQGVTINDYETRDSFKMRHTYLIDTNGLNQLRINPDEFYDVKYSNVNYGILVQGTDGNERNVEVVGVDTVGYVNFLFANYGYSTINFTDMPYRRGIWWGSDNYKYHLSTTNSNITFQNGTTVDSATVVINSSNDSSTYCTKVSLTTNSTGQIPTQKVIIESWDGTADNDYRDTDQLYYYCNPYVITISYTGYQTQNFTYNFIGQIETINLDYVLVEETAGAGTGDTTIYCVWSREIKLGDKTYLLCVDQDAQFRIVFLSGFMCLGIPILKRRRKK